MQKYDVPTLVYLLGRALKEGCCVVSKSNVLGPRPIYTINCSCHLGQNIKTSLTYEVRNHQLEFGLSWICDRRDIFIARSMKVEIKPTFNGDGSDTRSISMAWVNNCACLVAFPDHFLLPYLPSLCKLILTFLFPEAKVYVLLSNSMIFLVHNGVELGSDSFFVWGGKTIEY